MVPTILARLESCQERVLAGRLRSGGGFEYEVLWSDYRRRTFYLLQRQSR